MPNPQATKEINGVHIEELQKTIDAIKSNPELGNGVFRAHNRWMEGCHNQTRISDYSMGGQEFFHSRPFTLDADEPQMLGGNDSAPNPVQYLLSALASCLTTSIVAHASARGIHIDEIESELEGEIDLKGFLGLSEDVRKGFSKIRASFKVKTDEKDINKLKELASFSPVLDVVSNGTTINLEITKK